MRLNKGNHCVPTHISDQILPKTEQDVPQDRDISKTNTTLVAEVSDLAIPSSKDLTHVSIKPDKMTDPTKRGTESSAVQREVEKSYISSGGIPTEKQPEFNIADEANLVVCEDSVWKSKRMEIVGREQTHEGKFVYQVKVKGGTGELHKDEHGTDWFKENDLAA